MTHQLLRRFAAATAVVLALGGAATAVLAQGQGPVQAETSSWQIPGWSFTPGVTVSAIFDSNVALATAPADVQRTQGDQLFIVEPFGSLEYLSPRTEFTSGYRGFMRRYVDITQLNGFDQRGYASVRHLLSRRVSLFAKDSYLDVPTTDEVELNGVPFTRIGSRSNNFSGGVDARLTKFTSLSAQYDLMWVKFDRTEAFLTGGFVNGFRTNLRQHINERLSVGGEYSIRLADLDKGLRQLTFQDAGGTLEYVLTSHTSVSAAGGVSHLIDRTTNFSRTGPYVRGGVTRTGERVTAGASYERMFVPSFGFGGSNQSQELRTFVHMPFQRNRWYVDGSVAWRRSNPFVANELRLDTYWVRSTLGYGLSRWLRLEGFYAFSRQDSQVTGGEVNRHRGGMQIVISQPMRIH